MPGGADLSAIAFDTTQSTTHPRIILAGGFFTDSTFTKSRMLVLRLNPDGSLDHTFDGDGHLELSLLGSALNFAQGAVVQPSGKIVIMGEVDPDGTHASLLAMRLSNAGVADPTFGEQGTGFEVIHFSGRGEFESFTTGLNGRLFVGGTIQDTRTNGSGVHIQGSVVIALSANGVPDKTFGVNGAFIDTATQNTFLGAGSVAYQGDRVVLASQDGTAAKVLRLLDINPTITVLPATSTAREQGPTSASFFVISDQSLPFDTVVNFTATGTATAPAFRRSS